LKAIRRTIGEPDPDRRGDLQVFSFPPVVDQKLRGKTFPKANRQRILEAFLPENLRKGDR